MERAFPQLLGATLAYAGIGIASLYVAVFTLEAGVDPVNLAWAAVGLAVLGVAAFAIATRRLELAWVAGLLGAAPLAVVLIPVVWLLAPAGYFGGTALLTADRVVVSTRVGR